MFAKDDTVSLIFTFCIYNQNEKLKNKRYLHFTHDFLLNWKLAF